jgi:hypothetical protein
MIRLVLFALVISLPSGAVEYTPAVHTQAISTNNERPRLELVKITNLEAKWHQSGGMTKDIAFTSRKFRSGGKPSYAVSRIQVLNGYGYFQGEWGLARTYPDGARFDDVLINGDGVPFEHRVREKKEGRWTSRVEYRNDAARPTGYAGLKQTCLSCHEKAGTGGYGSGLVPGGDTVLSDPMLWSKVGPWYADDR